MGGQGGGRRPPVYQCPVTGIVPFRAAFKSHGSFGDHWHSEIEIFYLMPGSSPITVVIEEVPYRLSERDMLIVPSAAVHRIEATDEPNRVLRLDIGYPLLGENFRPFTENRFARPYISLSSEHDPRLCEMESIFHSISREKLALSGDSLSDGGIEAVISRMNVSAYLVRISALLLEAMTLVPLSVSDSPKQHASQVIQSVLFYLQGHYNEHITLDRASDLAGYEKTYFCRLFNDITGKTFHQYLTDLRLEKALPLLRETALPIASIAQSVGISGIKTFSRQLKQKFGMSAKEIRDKSRPATMNLQINDYQ